MKNLTKFGMGMFLLIWGVSLLAEQKDYVDKTHNIKMAIPNKWTIESKALKKKGIFSYILNSESKNCKIEIFFSKPGAPLSDTLLKQIINMKRDRIADSGDVKAIKTDTLQGYYFSAENPTWTKDKKLRLYIKRFDTYVVLSLQKFMINATIRHDKENAKEVVTALEILKSISIVKD